MNNDNDNNTPKRGKASLDTMEQLHCAVARKLASNLEDQNYLSLAIRFLKDNNVTTDILESESQQSLQEAIKSIAVQFEDETQSVEEMMGLSKLN